MDENLLISEIKNEIRLLESWIRECKYGGWSTNLVDPMEKRVLELKSIIYNNYFK